MTSSALHLLCRRPSSALPRLLIDGGKCVMCPSSARRLMSAERLLLTSSSSHFAAARRAPSLRNPMRRNMVVVTRSTGGGDGGASAARPESEEIEVTRMTPSEQRRTNVDDGDDSSTPPLTVTPSCTQRITELASKRRPDDPERIYLRVYVDAGGCSGFQYKFELEADDVDGEEIDPDDDVVLTPSEDGSGARVVVDRDSLQLLRGSTIDFVREMIRSSFAVVDNPQSETACGCGSSFAIKNFEANPAMD